MKHTTINVKNQLMTYCQCCGHTFTSNKEMHYVAKDTPPVTLIKLSEPGIKQYDAFDCPQCGCQIIVGERLRPVDEAVFALGDIDEVHEYGKEDEDASGEECQSDNDCEDDA